MPVRVGEALKLPEPLIEGVRLVEVDPVNDGDAVGESVVVTLGDNGAEPVTDKDEVRVSVIVEVTETDDDGQVETVKE